MVVAYRFLCFKYISEVITCASLTLLESADVLSDGDFEDILLFFTTPTAVLFSCCDLNSSSVLDFVSSDGLPSTLSTPPVELLVKVPRESGPPEDSGSLAVTANLAGPSTVSRICSSVFKGMNESPFESERFFTGYSSGSN